MDMARLPRKLLTGWVAHPRPNGCPLMTWGRTLKKALLNSKIATTFADWTKIAQDRAKWRKLIGDITASPTGPTARDERAARRSARAQFRFEKDGEVCPSTYKTKTKNPTA